jgi:hypothetical protein
MHVLEPFLPDLFRTPDHNESDLAAEFAAHTLIQKSLKAFMRGEMDLGTYDDILEHVGIDPIEYWEVVSDNVDAICDRGEAPQLEEAESYLLLPGRDF